MASILPFVHSFLLITYKTFTSCTRLLIQYPDEIFWYLEKALQSHRYVKKFVKICEFDGVAGNSYTMLFALCVITEQS